MADIIASGSLHNYIKKRTSIAGGRQHMNYQLATLVKNHQPFLTQLNLQRKMPVHEGCVNTLAWNDTGQYILSGSDDCCLCITKPNLCDFNEVNYTVEHKILSGHRANIFSAQFLPFTSDTKIASCNSNGPIIVTDVNSPETSGSNLFMCHRSTCYEVAPIPDQVSVFLSCGDDKTVRLFDLRTTQSCPTSNCQKNILIRGGYPMTTISINPVNPEQFLVGRSDGLGVLFDRRKINKDSALSYQRNHQQQSNQSSSDNSGELKLRGLNHPAHGAVAKFSVPGFVDTHKFTSLCFSPDGRQILASYSSDYIYLFDADRSSNVTLKNCLNRTMPTTGENHSPNSDNDNSMSSVASGGTGNNNDDDTSQSRSAGQSPSVRAARANLRQRTFRVRGDWSDTGPNSRPMGDSAEHRQISFMSRITRAASSLLINSPPVEEGLRLARDNPAQPIFIELGDMMRRPSDDQARASGSGSSAQAGGSASTSSNQDENLGRSSQSGLGGSSNASRGHGNEEHVAGQDIWISATVDDPDDDEDDSDESDNDHEDDGESAVPDFVYNMHVDLGDTTNQTGDMNNPSSGPAEKATGSHDDPRMRNYYSSASTSGSPNKAATNLADHPGSAPNNRGKNISPAIKKKFSQSFSKALEAVTQIPSYRPKKVYKGHRNCRTAIKEATFWGTNYIVSGSDCGHVFVWDKFSSDVVMIFQSDERVVNCIAPNPFHYCLATSGIDHDIKLWSTQFGQEAPLSKTKQSMDKIIRINEQMIQEDLNTITMPAQFFFRVLASFANTRIVEVDNASDELDYQ